MAGATSRAGHVARLLQVSVLPAANKAKFDLMPVAVHDGAIEMSIAIAHHHAIPFHHELPWRWVMLLRWWLMCLLHVGHRRSLLAFEVCPDLFSVGTQRLADGLEAGQVIQEPSCLTKGGDGTERSLPAGETSARLLARHQFHHLVWRAPAIATLPAVVPPAFELDRTQTCLHTPLALRLHTAPLLTRRAPR
jgi:hypothetical protein